VYRERLERFFGVLGQRLKDEAPELLPKIAPPADVPYGYQILPNLLPNPPRRAGQSRVVLSPFSWSRTDSMIDRGSESLATVEARLARMELVDNAERRREYDAITDEYRKLEAGQKLMVSTIAYNRLWQSEIARQPEFYREARVLQDVALTRQRILDSLSTSEGRVREDLMRRRLSLQADSGGDQKASHAGLYQGESSHQSEVGSLVTCIHRHHRFPFRRARPRRGSGCMARAGWR
jgi:hypothetical protein